MLKVQKCIFAGTLEVLAAVIVFVPQAHSETTIVASLQDSEIKVGDSTQLTVTLSGGADVAKPLLPDVKGLQLTARGQSTQMRYINGKLSTNVTFIYEVEGEEEGTYNIPPIQVRIGGHIIETDPMTLVVSGTGPSGGAPGIGTFGFGSSPDPTPSPSLRQHAADSRPAFLVVRPAKTTAYVGELIPVEISAYFAETMRVTLNSQPSLTGGAFTVQNSKNEPRETHQVSNARTYTVLTWDTAVSAAKEGSFPITGNLSATLLIRERAKVPQNPLFDNPFFDDDFFNRDLFDNFFGGLKEKAVTLTSKEVPLVILPLPDEGKPSSFNGAVGSFSMKASSGQASVHTGDPVTLRIKVAGSGNFDRVSKPALMSDQGWKTYNPEATFKPLDSIGYQGEKNFEQVLIPQTPEIKEIPSVVFSYFDPVQKRYQEITSEPSPLTVTGPAISQNPSPTFPTSVAAGQEDRAAPAAEVFSPIQIETGSVTREFKPIFTRAWFIQLAAIFVVMLAAGAVCRKILIRRLNETDYSLRLARELEVEETFSEIEKTLHEADAKSFLINCRKAAQLMAATKWGLEPEAITLSDIQLRGGDRYPQTIRIFELADAVSFSGQSLDVEQLKEMYRLFRLEVKNIK